MSASAKSPPPNLLTISNTKLACCLAWLGFHWQPRLIIDTNRDNEPQWRFHFWGPTLRPEFSGIDLEQTIRAWESGGMEKSDPMHPLSVTMSAMHNYDRLLEAIHGGVEIRLKAAAGGRLTRYHRGPELEGMKLRLRVPCTDLALVAAMGLVGVPVLAIDGPKGAKRFHLAEMGYVIQDATGSDRAYRADDLMMRSPTLEWPHRLAMEDREPMHPLVLGYGALAARAEMKRYLQRMQPDLKIREGGMTALIHCNYTGRVMDRITDRFGVAPI